MDQMDDEILGLFVEDAREHLGNIEAALMDMERGGADIDEELVNMVFRAAHSIKGGAGFLNLANIRDLSHKLENLLHMIRNREIVPDTRVINRLLAGFDRLLGLVESAPTSDGEDIAAMLADLSGLTAEHLSPQQLAQAAATIPILLPGGGVLFIEDELSIRQALAGGKNLYLVEYDLIHDVQARGRTPLDIITTMEASGLILDCRMELAGVGDLDAPPVNRIPFFVLFASIVEPDIVSYLFALDSSRIHPVELSALAVEAAPSPPAAPDAPTPAEPPEDFGPWRLCLSGDAGVLALSPGGAPLAAEARAGLLACLARGVSVSLSWSEAPAVDLAMLQVVVSAGLTFARRGLGFGHQGEAPAALSRLAERAGLTPQDLEAVGLPAAMLLAPEPGRTKPGRPAVTASGIPSTYRVMGDQVPPNSNWRSSTA
jgi:two-component system chemotaxis sensor kinase CheA